MSQQTPDVDSSLLSQCSGCPDAGTGGRANQLERISDLLGAPAWTSQPKGSTSLNLNVLVNPLAPEPVHKGHGSWAKKPPPYSASELVDPPAATSTKAKGKKAKVTKTAVIPPSSIEASDVQPSFHQFEAGARFGFSQHIIPPGTEPDLQVLNNPYVAAARKKVATMCLPAPIGASAVIRCLPATTTRSTKKNFVPPIPLRSMSAAHQSDHMFYQNLDPTLQSADDGSGQKDSGSDMSSKGSDTSTTDDDEDQEVGWGASKGYLTIHPGFSKEVLPSQPWVTTALPSDFKFQYSCDEDNNIALAVEDSASSDDDNQPVAIEPKPDDVLLHHQKKNRHPHESETKATMAKAPRSKEPSEPKPNQLGWYLPCWKTFLEDAKGDCCTQHTIKNAFPTLADDLPISVTEALASSFVEWLEGSKQVKPDFSTWCSNLKKTAVAIAPTMYNLIPPPKVPMQDHVTWVQNTTKELLHNSLFLCNSMDELGKTNNAAHPALWKAAISFLYTGSYCVARRRLDIFKKEILLNSLALIYTAYHCVLDGFIKNGNGKLFPKFSAKEYSTIYQSMIALLEDVKNDPYHGPKLMQQLHKWAAEGWAESCKLDGRDTTKHNHLQVILD
ncbi:hypothetical protein BDR06DRAFT_973891 [Suillus hirtellus]|nr:hypothetical protein BDR06DRAFT_973891 [Suillus hirtellus]